MDNGKQQDKGRVIKANWDGRAHKVFLDICEEEVKANNRPTQFLNALGYINLETKFNQRMNKNYVKKQFKNRWDTLRKEYNYWKQLLLNASGLGRDPETGAIVADADWWQKQFQVSFILL